MAQIRVEQQESVRTTVSFPNQIIQRSQHFLDKGVAPSRNAFVVAAVEHFLATLEQQEIDRQFAAIAEDASYQALNEQITEAWAESDWAALRITLDLR